MAKPKSGKSSLDCRADLLWGTGERHGRGPKPGLTLDRIVQTGIELAASEDLHAVTMCSVGEQLGVTTMALYRYVPGKEALIDAMVQAALGSPPQVDRGAWRAGLERWARADRAIFGRHPWLLDLATCAPVGPNWLAWLEAGLLALSDTGLTPAEMIAVVGVLDGHARSDAQTARGVVRDPRGSGWAEEWHASFFRVLERNINNPRYPTLSRLVTSGAFNEEGDEFEFGLQRVLDGIETFIQARRAPDTTAALSPPLY